MLPRRKSRPRRKKSSRQLAVVSPGLAIDHHLHAAGVHEGRMWRQGHPAGSDGELREHVQHLWTSKFMNGEIGSVSAEWPYVKQRGFAYLAGIREGAESALEWLPVPLVTTASAVVHIHPDPNALNQVLDGLKKLPLNEIIVVLGESADPQWVAAHQDPRIMALYVPDVTLQPDTARAAGAQLSGADIILFTDGDVPIDALASVLLVSCRGADIVLNDRTPTDQLFHLRGEAAWIREFMNVTLGRPDLGTNSLDVFPYAWSRTALDTIGCEALANPAKAYAAGVLQGLKVITAGSGTSLATPSDMSASAMAVEYAAAWQEAIAMRGPRLHFQDKYRNRSVAGGEVYDASIDHHSQL